MTTNQKMMHTTTMKGNTHKPFHTDNYVNDQQVSGSNRETAQSCHVNVFEFEFELNQRSYKRLFMFEFEITLLFGAVGVSVKKIP